MLKSRVENVHKLCEQIENFSRVIIYWKVPNGNSRKKVIVRKNKYEDPNRRLDITEKDKEAQRLSKWNYLKKKRVKKMNQSSRGQWSSIYQSNAINNYTYLILINMAPKLQNTIFFQVYMEESPRQIIWWTTNQVSTNCKWLKLYRICLWSQQ